jgi:predicted Co/Zn/Cd cation transporter (cation efflux family)
LGEVLGLSPDDLDGRVRAAAAAAVAAHGLSEFRSYVARAGRASMIEIHFVGRPGWNATLDHLDAIREALSTEIGGAGPHRWLTVSFTARPDWAE